MKITIEEAEMLLGRRDLEIYLLQKQIVELQKRVEELTPKSEKVE